MKPLNCRYAPVLAVSLLGLTLAGCQQTPAPVVVQPGSSTSTSERTTTTDSKVETQPGTPNPDGTVQTKTEQKTTVEKKQN